MSASITFESIDFFDVFDDLIVSLIAGQVFARQVDSVFFLLYNYVIFRVKV